MRIMDLLMLGLLAACAAELLHQRALRRRRSSAARRLALLLGAQQRALGIAQALGETVRGLARLLGQLFARPWAPPDHDWRPGQPERPIWRCPSCAISQQGPSCSCCGRSAPSSAEGVIVAWSPDGVNWIPTDSGMPPELLQELRQAMRSARAAERLRHQDPALAEAERLLRQALGD